MATISTRSNIQAHPLVRRMRTIEVTKNEWHAAHTLAHVTTVITTGFGAAFGATASFGTVAWQAGLPDKIQNLFFDLFVSFLFISIFAILAWIAIHRQGNKMEQAVLQECEQEDE